MKTRTYQLVTYFLFALLCFSSCQDEITDVDTPNEQETILADSVLANLITSTSANYGAYDDVLDNSSCFSVDLPVSILVNGTPVTIDTEADLETWLSEQNTNTNVIDFEFPITIIFSDYSEFTIENQEELQGFVDSCEVNATDSITCVDFSYPLSFSVFNTGFNLIETLVINNDESLFSFFNSLENNQITLIVSLNFPVSLQYTNGEVIEINTNEELTEAIQAAEENCAIGNYDCVEDEILINLMSCPWRFTDGSDNFENYSLLFNADNELQISEGLATSAIGGNWSLSTSEAGVTLAISELTAFEDSLEGEWIVTECEEGSISLQLGDEHLVLTKECNDVTPFSCFSNYEITECTLVNNSPVFNLSANTIGLVDCNAVFTATFHSSLIDAETDVNPIENTKAYEALTAQVYLRIEDENGFYEIYSITLITSECDSFECFQSFDAVLETCYTDATVLYEFNLPLAFANCTPSADNVTYYETLADAEAETNTIVTPEVYNTAELNSTVYTRVEINNQVDIFPIQLNVINCNAGSCTEGDIEGILTQCQWHIASYNGSDNLMDYNFDFEEDSGIVVIYTDTIIIDASWSTLQTNEGVVIEFSNVAGPNVQAINGNWLVVECTAAQLVLHNVNDSSNEIVIDRNCE
ncbi:hypothetical protein [Winogradskyella vidalii]|uniref:hypothetical protein n=1 Tax=Winogradskyella vidalii TaxID=2615024 RepID=UPI0015CC274A|nr:hypothetical protein [Winogradskyella vidalii]